MFTKENLRKIRRQIEGALSEELAEYDVVIRIGRIKFLPNSFTCRLEVGTKADVSGIEMTEQTKHFLEIKGLPLTEVNGYQIIGYHPRRHRYPVQYINDSAPGKTFKCSLWYIANKMGVEVTI